MPPVLIYIAGAVLAGMGMRFLKKEWRRVNDELDRQEGIKGVRHPAKAPTLRKDPRSGEWRVK
jgi:hypothetical protein